MPSRTLGPEKGWIVRSHISWRGEQSIIYKGVETSPLQARFKNLEGKPKRENSKTTISAIDCYMGMEKNLKYVHSDKPQKKV